MQEMERFLLEAQKQTLTATAQAVATALHERPQLMRLKPGKTQCGRRRRTASGRRRSWRSEPGMPVVVEEIGRESAMTERQSVAEINAILKGLERSTARIWVVNRELKLLALAGSLKPKAQPEDAGAARSSGRIWRDILASIWRDILSRILPRPAEDFDESLDEDVLGTGREVAHALLGAPATRLRNSADGRAMIVSAAHPIWSGDTVAGAVVVEETTHSILSVRNQALERLLLTTLVVFALTAAVAARLRHAPVAPHPSPARRGGERDRCARPAEAADLGLAGKRRDRRPVAQLLCRAGQAGPAPRLPGEPRRAPVARAAHAHRRGALLAGEPARRGGCREGAGPTLSARKRARTPVEDPHAHERGVAPGAEPAHRGAGAASTSPRWRQNA
ncbi:MAG: hypothetical protein M5R42_15075 [Rhodocyclaceae bacterium]|nr:hypothetical protein [Rhodocyclaceae bacterium]